MGALCPNLTDLTFETIYLSSHDDDDITPILLKVAELPALRNLCLDHLVEFTSQWPQSTIMPFPKLKEVFIRQAEGSGSTTFLSNLASTRLYLTKLTLGEGYYCEVSDLKETMTVAREHKGMETLMIYSRGEIVIDVLEPILQHHSLMILGLQHEGSVMLTDDDIEMVASSLVKLEYLALGGSWTEPPPLLTLQTISIAVALLPCLKTLSIAVDPRKPVSREQHIHVAPHHRLQVLHLLSSPAPHEVNDVTYFIAGLSDVEDFRLLSFRTKWDGVNAALPAMRVKRAADRDRIPC
ncbi:hypothetical protein FRB97_002349 [Tulasnella sp. 331]|nr:hypothetical protein FRB97_002349 [Tulasnella sp. 331]